jgi:hypothetical protein
MAPPELHLVEDKVTGGDALCVIERQTRITKL